MGCDDRLRSNCPSDKSSQPSWRLPLITHTAVPKRSSARTAPLMVALRGWDASSGVSMASAMTIYRMAAAVFGSSRPRAPCAWRSVGSRHRPWADFEPSPSLVQPCQTWVRPRNGSALRASDAVLQESKSDRVKPRSVRKKSLYPGDTSDMNPAPELGHAADRPRPR